MGASLSNLQVKAWIYLQGMDLYEARRRVIERVIKDRFGGNQSKFAEAANMSPSYVTRILADINEKSKTGKPKARKRLGDDKAMELEAIPELGLSPGDLLNPQVHGRNEQPASGSEEIDVVVHRPDGDTFFIEVKKSAVTESTLAVSEIEEFVLALLDIPPRRARETLAAVVADAEEFRQYARSYAARTRVTANPKHYLPSTEDATIRPLPGKTDKSVKVHALTEDTTGQGKSRGGRMIGGRSALNDSGTSIVTKKGAK